MNDDITGFLGDLTWPPWDQQSLQSTHSLSLGVGHMFLVNFPVLSVNVAPIVLILRSMLFSVLHFVWRTSNVVWVNVVLMFFLSLSSSLCAHANILQHATLTEYDMGKKAESRDEGE